MKKKTRILNPESRQDLGDAWYRCKALFIE